MARLLISKQDAAANFTDSNIAAVCQIDLLY